MAVTVEASGTQTATVTTEHTLSTETGAKTFVLIVDTSAMVKGDVLELRIKTRVLTGGTDRLVYISPPYAGVQTGDEAGPIKISVPVPSAFSCVFTLKQTLGTGRAYPWAVWSL